MRPKSDLLNNIELLWNEASVQSQNTTNQKAASTFQRINLLMQDALTVEQAANDHNTHDHSTHDHSAHDHGHYDHDGHPSSVQDHHAHDEHPLDDDIDALAALVHDAADQHASPPAPADDAAPFDQVMSQMDDVSRLKPPQEDNYNISSVEYDFGQAFTNLVRHVVRDYIHNEVESVIRNAISAELNAHFAQQHDQSHDGEDEK